MKNFIQFLTLIFSVGAFLLFSTCELRAQETRDIVPVFEQSRPPAQNIQNNVGGKLGGGKINNSASGANDRDKPTYQRINSRINSGKISGSDRPKPTAQTGKKPPVPVSERNARQIGVTIWKLEEAQASDGEFEAFTDNGRQRRLLVPRRVSTETIFESNDLVRLSFEASRRGYLYIINQEMFADGTLGAANLIFPNKRIRNGANLLSVGRPIELPDAKGNPFYFEMRQSNDTNKRLAAEVLTVIITDRPLPNILISERPLPIDNATLQKWQTKWAGNVEIFEPKNSSTRYTRREREAADGKTALTRGDALPQTVFLVEGNKNGGSMISIPLWYRN